MNIEQKIKALLEGEGTAPTQAQMSYPGATNPQDPAPYMGVGFETLELDRPGVDAAENIQQFAFPGQTMPDPQPLPPEYEEIDPYNIGATIAQVDKEHYPVGSGANDVVIPPDQSAVPGSEQYTAGIQQAAQPAPFVAESVQEEKEYTVHNHKGINGSSEGKVVEVSAPIEKVAEKLGINHADLHSDADDKDNEYSKTLVLQDKKGNKYTIYSKHGELRVRQYGHNDHDETKRLVKYLNEETDDQGQAAATEGKTPDADERDEIIQQAVAAIKAGNDINDVSKATGIPVDELQAALGAATPTQAPAAQTNTPAPVSESMIADIAADVDSLMESGDFTPEFKDRAKSLFESAVIARVVTESAKLEEAYQSKFEAEKAALKEEYSAAIRSFTDTQSARLNQYVNYLGETWLKQNKVAIINEMRNTEADKFMRGVKALFESSAIALDESTASIVSEKDADLKQLRESLEQAQSQVALMESNQRSIERNAILESVGAGMTDMDREKLRTLCEGVEFGSRDAFSDRVRMIKSNFFKQSVSSPEALLESSVHMSQPQDDATSKKVSPEMAAYVNALNRFKSH